MKNSLRPMLVLALVLSLCGFAVAGSGDDHGNKPPQQDPQTNVIQSQGLSNFSPSNANAGVNNSGNNTGNSSITGPSSGCSANGISSCSSNSGIQNTANGGAGGAGGAGGNASSGASNYNFSPSNSSSSSGVKDSGNSSNLNLNTANGGSVKDSGNSASFSNAQGGDVKNSGNSSVDSLNLSSNKNSNKQGQAQGQDQGQSQSSDNSNSNSGNNTTVDSHNVIQAPKIPVSTAYSPAAIPTASCALGYGAGGQGLLAGAAGGFTRIDKTCQQLEVARSFILSGARTAYCKTMIQTKWAKKAGVTMDDCMTLPAPPVVAATKEVEPPAPVAVQPVVDVNPRPLQ